MSIVALWATCCIISICPVDIYKYARFDEIPSMTLKDNKETKRYGHTDGGMDGQSENSIPTHKHSLRGGGGIMTYMKAWMSYYTPVYEVYI